MDEFMVLSAVVAIEKIYYPILAVVGVSGMLLSLSNHCFNDEVSAFVYFHDVMTLRN